MLLAYFTDYFNIFDFTLSTFLVRHFNEVTAVSHDIKDRRSGIFAGGTFTGEDIRRYNVWSGDLATNGPQAPVLPFCLQVTQSPL
jgi:hypothetical protein